MKEMKFVTVLAGMTLSVLRVPPARAQSVSLGAPSSESGGTRQMLLKSQKRSYPSNQTSRIAFPALWSRCVPRSSLAFLLVP
jgi:hypothetical protein